MSTNGSRIPVDGDLVGRAVLALLRMAADEAETDRNRSIAKADALALNREYLGR